MKLGIGTSGLLVEARPFLFCFILLMLMANQRDEFSVISVSYQSCSCLISEQYEACGKNCD